MSDHACMCYGCNSDPDHGLFPLTPRKAEHHVAVRFEGDRPRYEIFLDGVKHARCIEAYGGDPGWMYVVREPAHQCRTCDEDVCMEMVGGRVEIRTAEPMRRLIHG